MLCIRRQIVLRTAREADKPKVIDSVAFKAHCRRLGLAGHLIELYAYTLAVSARLYGNVVGLALLQLARHLHIGIRHGADYRISVIIRHAAFARQFLAVGMESDVVNTAASYSEFQKGGDILEMNGVGRGVCNAKGCIRVVTVFAGCLFYRDGNTRNALCSEVGAVFG